MKNGMELRYLDRIALPIIKVRERNGEFEYFFRAININEEHLFIEGRFCLQSQRSHSELQFSLPNGKVVNVQAARIIREELKAKSKGSIFEFVKIDEISRINLKEFIVSNLLRGTA